MFDEILDTWHGSRLLLIPIIGLVIFIVLFDDKRDVVGEHETQTKMKISKNEKTSKTRFSDEKTSKNDEKTSKIRSAPMAVDFTTVAPSAKPKRIPKTFGKGPKKLSVSLSSQVYVFYSTLTGSTERYARQLFEYLSTKTLTEPIFLNVDYIDDLDEYFVSCKPGSVYCFVVPSYETESPLDYFLDTIKETYNDFRIDSRPLSKVCFSVFGVGDKESWPERFCYQAKEVDRGLAKLGARRLNPLGNGCIKTDLEVNIVEWREHFVDALEDGVVPEADDICSDDEDFEEEFDEDKKDGIVDVEDMGKMIDSSKPKRKSKTAKTAAQIMENDACSAKEMVAKDSPTFKALTKQGYTIVGSHSGVKICRWTKSALRGRGSCYKFAFYGIKSHLCMETTPSLSCSNKCVFCWRHGTNPVGTTWRWQVDPPKEIIDGALAGHYQKIKMLRGVPGVSAERFAEAFRVKHCALSLVGEPIFYPHINEFVGMLHEKRISSFLVCNAQHPRELAAMNQVTQLYVSIDAATKESLKAVDRPLNRDFWERLQECLAILREKRNQRTVFRLTLVKGFNAEEVENYAKMVAKAMPCFIEVKGMTYCGTSKGNPLTMKNVPYYHEVLDFVEQLNEAVANEGLEYGIAAEHAHSCCVLIAQKRFYIEGEWHTHIDYDKFFNMLEAGQEFGPEDYTCATPSWAQYGSEEAGFNPADVRHRRGKVVEV